MTLCKLIKKLLRKPLYVYGFIGTGARARKDTCTGLVEFKLWQNGQFGHVDGYWHQVGDGWPDTFIEANHD